MIYTPENNNPDHCRAHNSREINFLILEGGSSIFSCNSNLWKHGPCYLVSQSVSQSLKLFCDIVLRILRARQLCFRHIKHADMQL